LGKPAAELRGGGGCKLGTMVNGNFPSYHPSDMSQPWPGETTTMSTLAFCLETFPLLEVHSSNTEHARTDTAPGVSWQRNKQVLTTPAVTAAPDILPSLMLSVLLQLILAITENFPEIRT